VARRALRIQDLKHPQRFESRLRDLLDLHNAELTNILGGQAMALQPILDGAMRAAEAIRPLMADVGYRLFNAHAAAPTCCSKARKARCSTSTTAPIRT
jgi:adenylosuccinate synthase